MTKALSPTRAAAFAAAYALLTLIGRATATEGQVVSLIWPGSGVALLWLLAESPRHVLRVLVPLMAIHFLECAALADLPASKKLALMAIADDADKVTRIGSEPRRQPQVSQPLRRLHSTLRTARR